MSSNIEFNDYSMNVKNAIKEQAVAFLHEVVGEVRSQASRESRRKSGNTAGKYETKVDSEKLEAHVGSDYWNAVYEEFGTGEHAINGGRKGYWVYVDDGSKSADAPSHKGKNMTLAEAKRAMAYLRSKGLNAYYTNGKTANRPLYKAFNNHKSSIEAIANHYFGELDE